MKKIFYFQLSESQSWVNKTTRIMKICLILLLISFHAGASTVNSPIVNVSLSMKNVTVKDVIKSVRQQTGFEFSYDIKLLSTKIESVNIDAKDTHISDVLAQVFHKTGIAFQIKENRVFLFVKKADNSSLNNLIPAQQDKIKVKGKVVNESNMSIVGANIVLKGTFKGVISNLKGEFEIEVNSLKDTLEVSFLGYNSQILPINNQAYINVTLSEDIEAISEIVVIGYGTQRKTDITAAVGSVQPGETNTRPVLSPDQLIQGRISGVVVSQGSGVPGSSSRVSIRGVGSLSASTEPLYVIDGIPVTNTSADMGSFGTGISTLAMLNPDDIKSIDVLKDAASASIYGSRATNGVILITTKKGETGQAKITANISSGISRFARLDKIKMADSDLYIEVINEAKDNFNIQNGYMPGSSGYQKHINNPYYGISDVDWMELVTRNALSYKANVSVSGGNDKTKYYISGNYTNQEGVFMDNSLQKYGLKLNLSSNIVNRLTIGTNANIGYSHNNRIPSGTSLGTNIIPRVLEQRPFDRPFKPDGTYYKGNTSEMLNHNPIQGIKEEDVYLKNYRMLGDIFAKIDITEFLSFKTSYGADVLYTEDYVYFKKNHMYSSGVGKLFEGKRLNTNTIVENIASYKHRFGFLMFDYLLGHSFQETMTSVSNIQSFGFASESLDVASAAAEIQDASSNLYGVSMQSFYTRALLNWRNRYLLNLSVRTDGSSRFAPEHRYGWFPSASFAWNISQEPFWKIKKTGLKLRISSGTTGNQEGIGAYAYQELLAAGYNYMENPGISISSQANPDLTWEKAHQYDAGFDLRLLDGKITLTADYFVKKTANLLYRKPVYATSGFTSVMSNIGSMHNEGYEAAVKTNFKFLNLKWECDLNVAVIRNELTSLIDDQPIMIGSYHVLKVGEEVGSFYLYKQLGVYQTDEEVPASLYESGVRAGDVIYDDVDGNGIINADDRQIVGSANPKFTGGFNNTFRYKGFDLSLFFTFSYGNKVYSAWTGGYRLGHGLWPMLESEALKRWTGPGTSNTTPRAMWGHAYNSTSFASTRFLMDGSFIRFRSLVLGYTIPQKWSSAFKVKRLRVYFQADNLYLFTKYPLLDPEVSTSLSSTTFGQDFMLSPQPQSINFGANINF